MFGDVILIFHDTEILIFFLKKKNVLEETDSCIMVTVGPLLLPTFVLVCWFCVQPVA